MYSTPDFSFQGDCRSALGGTGSKPARTRAGAPGPHKKFVEMNPESMGASFSSAVGASPTMNDALAEVPFQNGIDPALRLLAEVRRELPNTVKNQVLKLEDDAVGEDP